MDAHMVEQVIKYSDGSETVIKYRGVIVDGVLISEKIEEGVEEAPVIEAPVEEVVEAPIEVVESIEDSAEIID